MTGPTPVIVFAEVRSFYAAAERARDPGLRDRPIIVGGDPRKRGQVQSASPDALAAGVRPGMSMLEALDCCPRARAVRTDMPFYREVSGQLRVCLGSEVEALEPMGLDAAFLAPALGSEAARAPEAFAVRLQERVLSELGVPLVVGVAAVKFLARIAAAEAGESAVCRVLSGEEASFLNPLPVGRLPGVGPKTVARLEQLGAHKVGDLLRVGRARLEAELGNHGLRILEFARGEDASSVRRARHPRSLSRELTFDEPQLDVGVLWDRLQWLAKGLEAALRREGLAARRVALKLRYADLEQTTRSHTLRQPVSTAADIYAATQRLLDRTHAGSRAVRLLGVTLAGLASPQPAERQLELFSEP